MCKQGYYINTLFPLSIAVFTTFVQTVKQLCKSFNKKSSWKTNRNESASEMDDNRASVLKSRKQTNYLEKDITKKTHFPGIWPYFFVYSHLL